MPAVPFALRRLRLGAALLLAASLVGCGGTDAGQPAPLTTAAKLGEQIFNDASLSAAGQLACSGCPVPSLGVASNEVVHKGGQALDQSGTRNVPSLAYIDLTPAFFFDGEGTPIGGFNRDGRAASLIEQARRPFLSPVEMANESAAALVARLKAAPYAADFKALFGANIFEQGTDAMDRALFALASYQREDADFHPYSSKFDAFLAGKAQLSAQEVHGLALFNNPQKGNCAACHISTRGADGSAPLFTDFTYDNIGVPRNANIPANTDPQFFDLGLCGPDRSDLNNRSDLCGAFKVPTLRNIEKTAPYFHNGQFATLEETLRFYVRRDTNPEEWYPLKADGSIDKFNDLPDAFKANVNKTEVPYTKQAGEEPNLSEAEIIDVVAFLKTLTDGYTAP